jgi:hypothetical protein
MKNIPKDYSPADYAILEFLHRGTPPEQGVKLQQLPGNLSVVAVHLHDGNDSYMRTLVAEAEAVTRKIHASLSHMVLINNEGDPPQALASHPQASVVGDFALVASPWREVFSQQNRIVLIGWDARACVAQTLEALAVMLPQDEQAEFHFPLGALDDAKLDDVPLQEAKILLTTLMGLFARKVADVRGRTDVSYDGVYLARHEEGGPGTSLHFHSSVDAFGSNLNA